MWSEGNMIYTVTFNPSLDYVMEFDGVGIGELNRAKNVQITAGGKGINVSKILTGLGVDNLMLGFVGGFTGDEIEKSLSLEGYASKFIRLEKGLSRINVKVCSNEVTELNAPGPEITRSTIDKLNKQLEALREGDFLVLAGNIPEGVPEFVYSLITEQMNKKGVNTIVDTSGEALLSLLTVRPFLVKPNRQELGELFSTRINNRESAEKYALQLKEKGARNVLVSLDCEGAVLVTENDEVFYQPSIDGKVVNPVGAGDSVVAGFLWGLTRTGDMKEALKCGVCAGCASAFSGRLATGDDIRALWGLMK